MNNRGIVIPVLVWVLAGGAAGLSVWLQPWKWHSKPDPAPIAQLAEAQKERDQAKQDLAIANNNLQAAHENDHKDEVSQVGYSQQMLDGAQLAFGTIPTASMPPAYTFGLSLLDRAQNGLQKAIGDLPADKQAEIQAIVTGALSQAQSQIDAANKALAAKDAQLASVTTDRDSVKAQIPALEATAKAKDQILAEDNQLVDEKTAQVVQIAKAKDETTSLWQKAEATAKLFLEIIVGIALLWAFLALILPTLGTIIGPTAERILHDISGHLLSPITHAKQKATILSLKT